jgi:peroxiredoxin (alkyl hydroperoxide reductase subunit C)
MSLVGKKAPLFVAPAIENGGITTEINLADYIGKQELILFFYPKDFTFVCPTELFAFQEASAAFEERGVKVIGISTDTAETHWAWLNTPKNKGGIEGVKYPLVADEAKTIAMNYGVLGGDYTYNEDGELIFQGEAPIAYRGTFFIDKEGTVRHESVNFFPIGRNVNEFVRIVDAWHHFEEHGEVCPAGWNKGDTAMTASHEGVADYLANH